MNKIAVCCIVLFSLFSDSGEVEMFVVLVEFCPLRKMFELFVRPFEDRFVLMLFGKIQLWMASDRIN
jgi:hypothetical protein